MAKIKRAAGFILPFEKISGKDVNIAGGKGASLGRMLAAGIPVPNGFVILSSAFEKFIKEAKLEKHINAILSKIDPDDIQDVERASAKIRTLILKAEMPRDIASEITRNFDLLGSAYVAVRSSATSEDSEAGSWAGQLETYLNTTDKMLLENVQKCWASLFTPRAISYRFEKKMGKTQVSVAVVTQKMVQSESSGVAFSVHPVSQDENSIVIEAGYGLGEAIVSGQITPDTYVVTKSPLRIVSKKFGAQTRGLYRSTNGGTEWRPISKNKVKEPVLGDREVLELAKHVLKIEEHYRLPVDIEWARENQTFYIVQSRPITTLHKNTAKDQILKEISPVKKWIIMNTVGVPYIVNSCPWQFTQGTFQRYPENIVVTFCGVRYTKDGSEIQYVVNENEYRSSAKKLLDNTKVLEGIYNDFEVDESAFKAFVSKIAERGLEYLYKNYDEFIDLYNAVYISGFNIDGILAYGPELLKELNKKYPKHTDDIEILIRPYGEIFLARYRRKLVSLAFKSSKSLIKKGLRDLKEEFHWIYNNYKKVDALPISFFEKELAEVKNSKREKLKEELEMLNDAEEDHIEQVTRIGKKNIFSKGDFNRLIWLGKIAWIMDRRKECNLIATHYIGENLGHICKKNRLSYDKVSFLLPWELDSVLNKKSALKDYDIGGRKKNGFHFYDINGNQFFFTGKEADSIWLVMQATLNKGSSEVVLGEVAWRGKVAGIARIVKDPAKAKSFKEGDILVTGMTRPDYLPLMKKAAGFVTDEGGITSHAAIMAREMKKPCIIGTRIATSTIKDGDLIEVNANHGRVMVLKKK